MRKMKKICVLAAALLPISAAACVESREREVGRETSAVIFANDVDARFPEVGQHVTNAGSCTGTALPHGLVLLAGHCLMPHEGGNLPTLPRAEERIPREYLGEFVSDLDGDLRTTADTRRYIVRGGYRIGKTSGNNWDIAIISVFVPPGEPGPFERAYAVKGDQARHHIITSYADSSTPAALADLVVHIPFTPTTVFNAHHPIPITRVGMGFNNVILDADGGITDAFSPPYDDAGSLLRRPDEDLKLRFEAPGTTRDFLDWVNGDWRVGTQSPSPTAPSIISGDSGGPLLMTSAAAGIAIPSPYSPTEELLVGASSTGIGQYAWYTQTFTPQRGRWLEARIRQLLVDGDTDGIIDGEDNCPHAPNTDQANCNALAESIQGATVLGDACDPVPCPGATVASSRVRGPTLICGSAHRLAGRFCFGNSRENLLRQKPVGSSPVPSYAAPKTADVPLRGFPVWTATDYRFCGESTDFPCSTAENTERRAVLRQEPNSVLGDVGVWRGITLSTLTPRGANYSDYGVDESVATWNFDSDVARWVYDPTWEEPTTRNGCIPRGASTRFPNGICLSGLIWEQAQSTIGENVNLASGATVGLHGASLSSSIFPVNPYRDAGYYEPGVGWFEALRRPVILTLPDPPWWKFTFSNAPYQRNEALILSAVDSNALVVHPDGNADSMGSAVSGALYDVLAEFETMSDIAPTQQWIDLADPLTRDDRPLAVVARKQTNGSWKFDGIIDYYSGLNLESDYGAPLRYGSVTNLPTTPMVYSPEDDAIWTAGAGTLSRHASGTTSFVNVLPTSPEVAPINVKAVAFDAKQQVAWVIDYDAANQVRVLRFAKNGSGVWTGAVVAISSAVGAPSDAYYLHLTRAGSLMYARTNVAANKRTVARLTYDVDTFYAQILTGSPATAMSGGSGEVTGALLARPLLDGTGYHQMIAGEAEPVTVAGRGAAAAAEESEGAEGAYATDDPNRAGTIVPVASVLW